MKTQKLPYNLLAKVLDYPTTELPENSKALIDYLRTHNPDVLELTRNFDLFVSQNSLPEWQEYYTRTFDVNAICYLDLGYILFGEDYKRGMFLAHMSDEQTRHGAANPFELADHLPNTFVLLDRHPDPAFIEELAYGMIVPAIREMLVLFGDTINHYRELLTLSLQLIEQQFEGSTVEQASIVKKTDTCVLTDYCGYNPLENIKQKEIIY